MNISPQTLLRAVVSLAVVAAASVPLGQAQAPAAHHDAAAMQQLQNVDPGRGTDGPLLSEASGEAALLQLRKVNPGRGADGPLLSEASREAALLQLGKVNPGRGADGPLLSEASREAATAPPLAAGRSDGGSGFDWSAAGIGAGVAVFALGLGAVGAAAFVRHARSPL